MIESPHHSEVKNIFIIHTHKTFYFVYLPFYTSENSTIKNSHTQPSELSYDLSSNFMWCLLVRQIETYFLPSGL